jgi:hypothetical protein
MKSNLQNHHLLVAILMMVTFANLALAAPRKIRPAGRRARIRILPCRTARICRSRSIARSASR